MKKICLLIGLILSFAIINFAQESERTIDLPSVKPPLNITKVENGKFVATEMKGVELVSISVEGKAVTIGNSFTAGDDWLKTLTVKLKNVSDKTISSVNISFAYPEAKFNDSMTAFTLAFGSLSAKFDESKTDKAIKPGEEFELTQTEKQFLAGRAFVINRTGVTNITKVIVGMTVVKFEDGEVWSARILPAVK